VSKIVSRKRRPSTSRHAARLVRVTVVLVAVVAAACSSAKTGTKTTTAPKETTSSGEANARGSTTTTAIPSPHTNSGAPPHVMVVMMENKGYSQVIGQSDQPFTNSLASGYGMATRSYAFGHPSLPNYIDVVSGSNQGVTDDNPPSSHNFPGTPTLADQLAAAGRSAKAYAENLPADPTTSAGEYAVRHVPWEYFPHAKITVADGSSLLSDLNGAGAPDFVWYTPNLIDDEHDGTVQQGDAFLSRFVPQVQSTAWYRAGGVIIVEWDESDADNSGINGTGGGHIPTIVVSAALKAHPAQDSTSVDTVGVLRSIEDAYGLAHLGAAASAANGNIDALLTPTP
jgi:acid phosphatase